MESRSEGTFRLGLWGQGVESEFLFCKTEPGDLIEVSCESLIKRRMTTNVEVLAHAELCGQLETFVENYRQALRLYTPKYIDERWNQELLTITQRLKLRK